MFRFLTNNNEVEARWYNNVDLQDRLRQHGLDIRHLVVTSNRFYVWRCRLERNGRYAKKAHQSIQVCLGLCDIRQYWQRALRGRLRAFSIFYLQCLPIGTACHR